VKKHDRNREAPDAIACADVILAIERPPGAKRNTAGKQNARTQPLSDRSPAGLVAFSKAQKLSTAQSESHNDNENAHNSLVALKGVTFQKS